MIHLETTPSPRRNGSCPGPRTGTWTMVRATAAATLLAFGLATGGCGMVRGTVDSLQQYGPSPDLGRPAYVRSVAGFGGWLFGSIGAVVSLAALPVTYPISMMADRPLGMAQAEFRLAPIPLSAAAGHFLLGAPVDMIDFLFRRAWMEEEPPDDYSLKPMPDPKPLEAPLPKGEEGEQGEQGEQKTGEQKTGEQKTGEQKKDEQKKDEQNKGEGKTTSLQSEKAVSPEKAEPDTVPSKPTKDSGPGR